MEQKRSDALESMFDVETRIGVTVAVGGLVLLISIPTSQMFLTTPLAAHFHSRRTQQTDDGELPA